MRKVNVVKRGKVYQYKFEIAPKVEKENSKTNRDLKPELQLLKQDVFPITNIFKQDVVLNHRKYLIVII